MTIWTEIQQFSADAGTQDCLILPITQGAELPLPPPECRLYNENDADHLAGGRYDYEKIADALDAIGHPVCHLDRILDFGCSNGRVLRWFLPQARRGAEIWGADIDPRRAFWAQQAFAEANIVITTPIPHLPFADGYFNLVYANSIFTHLDPTFMAWFLEIARVVKPAGHAWLTVNDEVSVQAILVDQTNYFFTRLKTETRFLEYAPQPFDWFAVGEGVMRNVFFRRQWIIDRLRPVFDLRGVFERTTGGMQTALLLERRAAA